MPSYAVVGASRGIGLGFIKKLSADPQNVVIALVRNPDKSPQLHEYIESNDNAHKNVQIVKLDLEDSQSIQDAATSVSAITGGSLEVLINNGALLFHETSMKTFTDYPSNDPASLEKDLLTFFRPNVIGVAQTIGAFLPLIKEGQTKKVLVVTSSMGSPAAALGMESTYAIAYSTSKAALNMIVAKYALAYKNDGIVFLAVSPGLVKTAPGDPVEVDKMYEGIVAKIKSNRPEFRGVLTVEQSVDEQLKLLDEITIDRTGAFLHSHGADGNLVE